MGDTDCASLACDQISFVCVSDRCNDHLTDCSSGMSCPASGQCVSEPCTDTDCGGACLPCSDGKKCKTDTDCTSYACDAASHTCTAGACALGKSCLVSPDCASEACDALKLVCISDSCADHRKDGFETDVDCGGGSCGGCTAGQTCGSNFDCIAGHFFNSSKVCQ